MRGEYTVPRFLHFRLWCVSTVTYPKSLGQVFLQPNSARNKRGLFYRSPPLFVSDRGTLDRNLTCSLRVHSTAQNPKKGLSPAK